MRAREACALCFLSSWPTTSRGRPSSAEQDVGIPLSIVIELSSVLRMPVHRLKIPPRNPLRPLACDFRALDHGGPVVHAVVDSRVDDLRDDVIRVFEVRSRPVRCGAAKEPY